MTRLALRVCFIGGAVALLVGIVRALLVGDVDLAVAWGLGLLWLAVAAAADVKAERHAAAVSRLTAERDDARAQLRRAQVRLANQGERWQDLRVNGGQPL